MAVLAARRSGAPRVCGSPARGMPPRPQHQAASPTTTSGAAALDEEAGKTFSLQQCVDSLEEAISAARKAKVSVVEEEMREARETVTPARSAALKKK